VKAVAVGFLYGFIRPEHEARQAIVREEMPEAFISASHEIAPEFREYERLSTVGAERLSRPGDAVLYREADADRLEGARHHGDAASDAVEWRRHQLRRRRRGCRCGRCCPGPSTGVVGAQAIGKLAGFEDLITFDMGGTSTDVALLRGGQCRLTSEAVVHGYPIKAPMLDIHTVGAGGGSLAHVDAGGLLKVGPRSCGADPGPVCYDGQRPSRPSPTPMSCCRR
jgi:N-methylhydantoinase A